MRILTALIVSIIVIGGCEREPAPAKPSTSTAAAAPAQRQTLADARKGFITKLTVRESDPEPPDAPPADLFTLAKYPSAVGDLAAYVSPDPGDGARHPAIVWVFGGFGNGIDATAWEPVDPADDQSAAQYREAGLVMMYPAMRGGSGNPGVVESFFGEVDDVIAAADYLAKLPYVDPDRIYLGGHSTGGSLVMLVAASTDRFRAVIALGPVEDVADYGADSLTFDPRDADERRLRAPGRWLEAIRTRTFVIEGDRRPSNTSDVGRMLRSTTNPALSFYQIKGADHFSIIAPANRLLASKLIADTGPTCAITLTPLELFEAVNGK